MDSKYLKSYLHNIYTKAMWNPKTDNLHASFLREKIRASRNSQPSQNADYLGTPHLYHGLRSSELRTIIDAWYAGYKSISHSLLDDLYHGESYEERCAGGMLLAKFPEYRRRVPFQILDDWLEQLVGWAEVDATCHAVFTLADLLEQWGAWVGFLSVLNKNGNINKRRASLVFLIRPIRENNDERLITLALVLITNLLSETDALITNAISWLLQEGVTQHHSEIEAYINDFANELPQATLFDVRQRLQTGKK